MTTHLSLNPTLIIFRFCCNEPPPHVIRSDTHEMLVLFRSYSESRVCDDVKYPWKCKQLFTGFKAKYYTCTYNADIVVTLVYCCYNGRQCLRVYVWTCVCYWVISFVAELSTKSFVLRRQFQNKIKNINFDSNECISLCRFVKEHYSIH